MSRNVQLRPRGWREWYRRAVRDPYWWAFILAIVSAGVVRDDWAQIVVDVAFALVCFVLAATGHDLTYQYKDLAPWSYRVVYLVVGVAVLLVPVLIPALGAEWLAFIGAQP